MILLFFNQYLISIKRIEYTEVMRKVIRLESKVAMNYCCYR